MFMRTYASSRVKRKNFYRKSELQMFLLISGGHIGAPKQYSNMASPYKDAWNVSANNSETVGHKDVGLGQIVYILVFYNIPFSWLLPLDGLFFCCVIVKTIYCIHIVWKQTLAHETYLIWSPIKKVSPLRMITSGNSIQKVYMHGNLY